MKNQLNWAIALDLLLGRADVCMMKIRKLFMLLLFKSNWVFFVISTIGEILVYVNRQDSSYRWNDKKNNIKSVL